MGGGRTGPWLPLTHLATGLVAALLAGCALVVEGPALVREPPGALPALALVHLLTLGWLATTILGATYQMVPVVLEVRLARERLAWSAYPVHVAGVTALVAGFATGRLPVAAAGASLVVAALLSYAAHILWTAARAPARARRAQGFVVVATGYLVVGLALGGTLALGLAGRGPRADLLPAHVVVAVFGWATTLAMGAAYRLTPMFALSRPTRTREGWVLALAAVGAAALACALAAGWPRTARAAAALPALAAVVLFVGDQVRLLVRRTRPSLDVGLRLTAVSLGYLLAAAVATTLGASGLRVPGGPALPVSLALLGWLGCLVPGQTYKIVPFLVWLGRHAPRAGREPVPLLREMVDARWAVRGFWGTAPAATVLGLGVALGSSPVVRLGALLWLFGYAVLGYQVIRVFVGRAYGPSPATQPGASRAG